MDSLPANGVSVNLTKVGRLKARSNRLQQWARAMNQSKRGPLFDSISTMTVSARCRGRNRRMTCFLDRVMTVSTIQFQLTGMKFVRKRDRLLRSVPNIDDARMDRSEQTCR